MLECLKAVWIRKKLRRVSMKKFSKVLLFLLVALMVVGSFASCGETTTAGKQDDPEQTDAPETTVAPEEPEETYFIPETKYDNEEFVILCPGSGDNEWECHDFWAETDSDDGFISAVYARQTLIEEQFGIDITLVEGATRGTISGLVMTDTKSGDCSYDLVLQIISGAYSLAQNDNLANLSEIPHLDLSSASWDQSYLEQTSIGGKNFFATGDITTMDNDGTWIMMFNKKLHKSLDLPNLYDLVKAGDWTFDTLLTMCKDNNLYQDNGNGVVDHEDQFPIASTIDLIQGLFYAADARFIRKDSEDIPYIDYLNDRNTAVIDKIIDIYFKDNKITFDCHDYASVNASVHLIAQEMFEEDRALFYSEVMQCAIRLRDMDTDYGILPMPKFDKTQEYTTHVVAGVTLCAMFEKTLLDPSKSEQLERAGMVAQALAVEGMNILTPAYYEKSIIGKGMRDAESLEMLPIIFANRTCDLGYAYESSAIAGFFSETRSMIKAGQNNIASVNSKNAKKIGKQVAKLVDAYEDLD